jgi:hypothetical protein
MFLVVELFRWWYTDGWKQRTVKMATNLEGTLEAFFFLDRAKYAADFIYGNDRSRNGRFRHDWGRERGSENVG